MNKRETTKNFDHLKKNSSHLIASKAEFFPSLSIMPTNNNPLSYSNYPQNFSSPMAMGAIYQKQNYFVDGFLLPNNVVKNPPNSSLSLVKLLFLQYLGCCTYKVFLSLISIFFSLF